jgi:hypothetical protein
MDTIEVGKGMGIVGISEPVSSKVEDDGSARREREKREDERCEMEIWDEPAGAEDMEEGGPGLWEEIRVESKNVDEKGTALGDERWKGWTEGCFISGLPNLEVLDIPQLPHPPLQHLLLPSLPSGPLFPLRPDVFAAPTEETRFELILGAQYEFGVEVADGVVSEIGVDEAEGTERGAIRASEEDGKPMELGRQGG